MSAHEDDAVAQEKAETETPGVAPADEAGLDDEEKLLLHDERSCIFETRVERAAMCRDRGSKQFKDKQLKKAIEWYERALYHVDFDEGTWYFEFMDKHRDAVNEVRLPVYLNLAACYLNDVTLDLAKCAENADLALKIDPQNTKALYRGGKAQLLRGDLDDARKKLTQAAKNQPSDRNIREALHSLKEKLTERKEQEKQTWGGRLLSESKNEHESDASISSEHNDNIAETVSQQTTASNSTMLIVALLILVIAVVIGWFLAT